MSVAGIDVGDSTSCIALARKGGVDVLLNKESKRETPSVISFTSKMRLMGTDAVGSMSTNPRNTVSQLKRLMGKKFNDPHVQKDLEYFPFEVSAGPNGECVYNVTYLDKPAQFTAEQLMAMLLVDLKSIAETDSGAPVSDAVLSVPTYYTEPERHAMLGASQLAGLNCLRLMNETTATALSYGIYKTDLPETDPVHVVFVDIGFSSTQVCVVALKKGQLQVLSNAWDRDLGGRDLDSVLFEHFVKEFKERYKIDVKTQPRACHRLRLGCEKVKKVLTTNSEAPLNVECLMNDIDAHGMITREVFEEEAKPVLDRLLAPVQKALAGAGLEASQVANVEVVGGTTRVPAVLRQLTELFGREPSRTLNAKETVSRGCALQCAMLSPTFRVRDFQVLDSFPYGVQFSWEKDGQAVTSVVFERGSLVPSAKMLTFYRSEPFAIRAEYTPDSDIPATADRSIGSFDIGPFSLPAGADKAKLKVKVMLNLNGVVVVEHAQMIEEEEVEEDAPAAAAPAADQPMADADADKAAGGEAAAAGAEPSGEAANGEAPMATDAAPAKVTKKKVKKHSVPVASHTAALSSDQVGSVPASHVPLFRSLVCTLCCAALLCSGCSPLNKALSNPASSALSPVPTPPQMAKLYEIEVELALQVIHGASSAGAGKGWRCAPSTAALLPVFRCLHMPSTPVPHLCPPPSFSAHPLLIPPPGARPERDQRRQERAGGIHLLAAQQAVRRAVALHPGGGQDTAAGEAGDTGELAVRGGRGRDQERVRGQAGGGQGARRPRGGPCRQRRHAARRRRLAAPHVPGLPGRPERAAHRAPGGGRQADRGRRVPERAGLAVGEGGPAAADRQVRRPCAAGRGR
jgi:heat shock protein 4